VPLQCFDPQDMEDGGDSGDDYQLGDADVVS
jgi:hypothetical protein